MEEKKYSVYSISTPDGKVYYSLCTGFVKYKFYPSLYKNNKAIQPYIERYGWDSLVKDILLMDATEKEAKSLLYEKVKEARDDGVSLNMKIPLPPGYPKEWRQLEYQRRWREAHPEKNRENAAAYYYNNRERCIERQKAYNRRRMERMNKVTD